MGKVIQLFAALYSDGLKLLGLLAPLASVATTICKWAGVTVGGLQEISWGWVLAPLTLWLLVAYVRRWLAYVEHIENPRPGALSLPQISVADTAKYLRSDSAWAWQTFSEINSWETVKDFVTREMTRAGASHDVRYIGTLPNSSEAIEIDRTYWRYAEIDDSRIWDARNHFFSVLNSRSDDVPGLVHYQYGTAPRSDVFRTWPRASLPQKLWARAYVRLKKFWWRLICPVEHLIKRWRRWRAGNT